MAESTDPPLLIALGDSITAGVGGKWNKGYPTHLHKLLKSQIPDLKLVNWGIPGLTIPRLTRALQKGEHLHPELQRAACIVMTICGNDIIGAFKKNKKQPATPFPLEQIETLKRDLDVLMQTLGSITSAPIYLGDLYNPFPQSAEADVIIGAVNQNCLYTLADKYPGVRVVRISETLRGQEPDHIQYYKNGTVHDLKKFWRNPIHPNDLGHSKIAEAFYHSIISGPPFVKQKPASKPLKRTSKPRQVKQARNSKHPRVRRPK